MSSKSKPEIIKPAATFKPEIIKPAAAPAARPGPEFKPEIIKPAATFKPEIIEPLKVPKTSYNFREAEEASNASGPIKGPGYDTPAFEPTYAPTTTAPTPTPATPTISVAISQPTAAIKTATPDIVLFDDETIDEEQLFDLILENIGGQELISITRSDIVNGQKISYQPIKNLSAIQQRYNSNNILSLQQTADKFFAGFSIKLEDKIPETGNGTNGENVYLNAAGDLIIEFINVNPDEQVETQISVSGTIYEADLGDYTS